MGLLTVLSRGAPGEYVVFSEWAWDRKGPEVEYENTVPSVCAYICHLQFCAHICKYMGVEFNMNSAFILPRILCKFKAQDENSLEHRILGKLKLVKQEYDTKTVCNP